MTSERPRFSGNAITAVMWLRIHCQNQDKALKQAELRLTCGARYRKLTIAKCAYASKKNKPQKRGRIRKINTAKVHGFGEYESFFEKKTHR